MRFMASLIIPRRLHDHAAADAIDVAACGALYYAASHSARQSLPPSDLPAYLVCALGAWHPAAMHPAGVDFSHCSLLGVDIDGTLTDGTLLWGGPQVGWTQRYAVRDGEALVRLRHSGFPVVPISRNKTACARERMAHLGLPLQWVGVSDKLAALGEVEAAYGISRQRIAYVGDGREDAEILAVVGFPCCVRGSHPAAQAAAAYTTVQAGGAGAIEEIIDLLLAQRPPS
ncbi:MAG: hypothetical protein EOO78_20330 [Oxalobacteraceae bacterium]|nr:MAG: hypothetical protein EOO78_20330 [Oxalobacteraceae bacterium]